MPIRLEGVLAGLLQVATRRKAAVLVVVVIEGWAEYVTRGLLDRGVEPGEEVDLLA